MLPEYSFALSHGEYGVMMIYLRTNQVGVETRSDVYKQPWKSIPCTSLIPSFAHLLFPNSLKDT